MRYWLVNQNQTYRHEVPGGYMWSPKVKASGHANAFYDFTRQKWGQSNFLVGLAPYLILFSLR
jgi:hypothetical protein